MDQKNIQNARRTGTIPKIKQRNNSSGQTSGQTNINQEFEAHPQFHSNVENWPHSESLDTSKGTATFRKLSADNIVTDPRGDQKNEEFQKQLNQIQEYLQMIISYKNQPEYSNENSFKKMRNLIDPGYNPVKKSKTLTHEKSQMFNANTEMHMSLPVRTNDYNNSRNPESEIGFTTYIDYASNSADSIKSLNPIHMEYLKSMNVNYLPGKPYNWDIFRKQIKNDTERTDDITPIGSEDNFHEKYQILQEQIHDLDNKKKVVSKLMMEIKNTEEIKNKEFGGKVKKIAYMQQQLDDLKSTLLLPENTDNFDTYECCAKMDNIMQEKNHPHECYNGTCYFDSTQQDNHLNKNQTNKRNMARNRFILLQAEVDARKKELKNMISKTRDTVVNLNQHLPFDNKIERSDNRFPLKDGKGNLFYPNPDHLPTNHPFMCDATNNHIDNMDVNCLNANSFDILKPRLYQPLFMPCNKQRVGDSETPLSVDRQIGQSQSCEFDLLTSPQCHQPSKVRNQLESIKMICETMLSEASGCDFNKKGGSERSSASQVCSDDLHAQKNLRQGYGMTSHSSPTQSNSSKVRNWMDSNAVQTNAFMINSLHMCCEMLNLQQKEIVSLKKTVDTIQNINQKTKPDSGYSTIRSVNTNHVSPNEISGANNFIRPQNFRKINSSVENYLDNGNDQYCSGLNDEQMSFPINFNSPKQHGYNTKNLENNFKMPSQCYHPSLESSNENLQSQMWRSSQALNNQVAPGIRANNYWDNFRSYSRQNLLSRKCNEDFRREDLPVDDVAQEPPPLNGSASLLSKHKEIQEIPVAPHIEVNAPSEVVQTTNISRSCNTQNDDFDIGSKPQEEEFSLDNNSIIGSFLNFCSDSDEKEKQNCKTKFAEQKLENVCYGESQPDGFALLNYPEEMRESIYREVALLISLNQNRLEYLIQVFKDLQFIKSDGMRRKLLRKIKSLVSENNLAVPINQNNEIVEPDNNKEEDVHYHNLCANNTEVLEISTESMNIYQEAIPEIVDFLNNHDEEHLSHNMILALHQILNDITIPAVLAEVNFKNIKLDDFMTPLSHWLQNLSGKLVKSIKTRIFYKIHGTLKDMKQFDTKEIKEIPSKIEPTLDLPASNFNGDLAEADQINKVLESYEEGAVGGIINGVVDAENSSFWGEEEEKPGLGFKLYPG